VDGWVGKDPCGNEEQDKAWTLGGIFVGEEKTQYDKRRPFKNKNKTVEKGKTVQKYKREARRTDQRTNKTIGEKTAR
jgi:hypothetical protein